MTEETDPAPRIAFNMGLRPEMEGDIGEHQVLIDNVRLEMISDEGAAADADASGEAQPQISVNQVGWRNDDIKTFFVQTLEDPGEQAVSFRVIREDASRAEPAADQSAEPDADQDAEPDDAQAADQNAAQAADQNAAQDAAGECVLTGECGSVRENASTGTWVRPGDFSEVTESGRYHIEIGEGDETIVSPSFEIGEDVYDALFKDVVRMLYLQRCGTATDEAVAGTYAHPACHDQDARVYGTDEFRDVSGGWHDAGDYGRYVVPGAKTVADLFFAAELWGAEGDDYGIPESGNGVPDLLDEARTELEWMLKMQDEDGGVHHKVTCRNFPGSVMPQDDTDELVIAPVSVSATGDFAAVCAMAARLYEPYDEEFALKMKDAALLAYGYLQTAEDEGFTNPSDIVTGEYSDIQLTDERFWAAAELAVCGIIEEDEMPEISADLSAELGWQQIGGYALADLALSGNETAAEMIIDRAVNLLEAADEEAYGISLGMDYPWGSNMTVANNAMILLLAGRLTGGEEFGIIAKDHLNYLLGANGTGYCYVSGYGTLSPEHPHHRPSQAAGQAVIGMLAGGPDGNLEDPYAKGVLEGKAPALCYVDSDASYSTNEVAIYWNSPLICLLAAFL